MNPVYLAIAVVAIANTVASFSILRSDGLTARQRVIQLALVWLLPLVGAVICWAFASSQSSPSSASSSFVPLHFPSDGAGCDGHGLGGSGSSDGGSGSSH